MRVRFLTRPEEDAESLGPRRVNDSRWMATVRERRLLNEEFGPVDPDAESASARGWVSVPGSCMGIFEYMLVTDTEEQNTRKEPKTSPFLRFWLTQFCACLFFFPPLTVVYFVSCVCKAMWNAPDRRWEKLLNDLMAMSWFKRLR